MKLFTVAQREVMTANALASRETDGAIDHWPVVKLFMPDGGGRWLLSEVSDDGMAFGLCDLGLGCPELGFVPLDTLQAVRGVHGLPVERDLHFVADKTLSAYAQEARAHQQIVA